MMRTTGAFGETFSPLRDWNLALYLGGQAISLVGTWMQAAAQSWVVWQLSHSNTDMGLVAMLGALPLVQRVRPAGWPATWQRSPCL